MPAEALSVNGRPHPSKAPIRGDARRSGDGFRPDIQGLRGIAVLVVALCHAGVTGMNGGYVGVDVFFVISGFLITGWLLGRALESGRVPFRDFYASRARRILPAAVLTLVVTCAASVTFLNPVRAESTLDEAVWAASFSANVRFAGVGTDYFAQDDPPSAIQHFWTLAVEEQFYVVWPLLLAAALLALRIRRRSGVSRGGLAGVVALGVGASLAWSIYLTGTNPSSAYFSTPARAWELGVGALIAVGLPWILQAPAVLRAALTWVGLAGIVVATVTFGSGTPFPGLAALLPVCAAGLVIAGGAGQAHRAGAAVVLGRQPLRLVGDLSYAFYLWHWPMLVIAAQYAGHPLSTLQNVALLAAAFVVSYVTYRLYENPLRHCRSLRRPRRALVLWPASLAAVALAVVLGTSAVATPSAAAPTLVHSDVEQAGQRSDAKPTTVRQALLEAVSPARLRQPVPRALAPPLGQLLSDRYHLGTCVAGSGETSARLCQLGDTRARRLLIVLGDSHAVMWMPALIQLARRHHWRLVPLVKTGCVPAGTASGSCATWYRWALAHVRRLHPRAVVLSHTWWSGSALEGIDAVSRELQDLAPLTPRLAVIEDPPGSGRATLDCLLARRATLGSCAFRVTPDHAATYSSLRREARAVHAAYVPTLGWFCVRGLCPAVVGTIVTYRDSTHITATYARQLARSFGVALAAATS
jgi:peptidoglycan/LPS O-acetylase OafA/YrhL